MSAKLPDWIANVPLKTVGVLCATHIFGKNIESRHIVLVGKRYFHNAVENVVGYVLNPILPRLESPRSDSERLTGEAAIALQNIRDCFNYIFHIQVEYFKILNKLWPERFRSERSGTEFNLNWFSAKSPTLINSEKRYLILSKIDGVQPYDLDVDWNADFDWVENSIRESFRDRLFMAQEAYAATLHLGEWYSLRDKNLIIPLRTIMDDLSEYFEHLGLAAYLMAKNGRQRSDEHIVRIREHLLETCRHLERFTIDMMRMNVFSIIKHDVDRLDDAMLATVIRVRAEDDLHISPHSFHRRRDEYGTMLQALYKAVGYNAAG